MEKFINPDTIAKMQNDIKKKADLNTNNVFKGNNDFKKMPTVNGDPIVTNELNGTNYLMVYGTGTPAENAAELQAAYDAAKTMPRYLGVFEGSQGDSIAMYAGQTYTHDGADNYLLIQDKPIGTSGETSTYSISITPGQAKSVHITLIVAPGDYDFNEFGFNLTANSINVVSLTGNSDIIISPYVTTGADYSLIKGVYSNKIQTDPGLANLIYENCVGLSGSFAFDDEFSSTAIYCIGGLDSFGGDGGSLTGQLQYCKLTSGTFKTPTGEGKIYNSIDGNGNLVNYPPLFGTKTSQVVNGLTDVVDTSNDIIIYKSNDKLILPSASTMRGKSITIKNNFTSIQGNSTMEFSNSIIDTPTNRTIIRKFACPSLDTFLVVGSIIVVGGDKTEMSVDSVHAEFLTVTEDIPTDVSIGSTIVPDIPITVYSDEFDSINGLSYELVYINELKEFYSNGDKWFIL